MADVLGHNNDNVHLELILSVVKNLTYYCNMAIMHDCIVDVNLQSIGDTPIIAQ